MAGALFWAKILRNWPFTCRNISEYNAIKTEQVNQSTLSISLLESLFFSAGDLSILKLPEGEKNSSGTSEFDSLRFYSLFSADTDSLLFFSAL